MSIWSDRAGQSRPVTLFTGQWADLPLALLAEKASEWGYDGLELACELRSRRVQTERGCFCTRGRLVQSVVGHAVA